MNNWDIIVRDKNDRPVLAVEAKRRPNTTAEWASDWRENILKHSTEHNPRDLLMVFPDKFYMWKNAPNGGEFIMPDFDEDAVPHLSPYFERLGISLSEVRGHTFELIVWWWLAEMSLGLEPDADNPVENWLSKSGLYETILNGKIDWGEQ